MNLQLFFFAVKNLYVTRGRSKKKKKKTCPGSLGPHKKYIYIYKVYISTVSTFN